MPSDRPVLCLTQYSFTLRRNPVLFFYVTFHIRAYSEPGTATVPEAAPQRSRQGLSADFMGVASSHHAQSIAPCLQNTPLAYAVISHTDSGQNEDVSIDLLQSTPSDDNLGGYENHGRPVHMYSWNDQT